MGALGKPWGAQVHKPTAAAKTGQMAGQESGREREKAPRGSSGGLPAHMLPRMDAPRYDGTLAPPGPAPAPSQAVISPFSPCRLSHGAPTRWTSVRGLLQRRPARAHAAVPPSVSGPATSPDWVREAHVRSAIRGPGHDECARRAGCMDPARREDEPCGGALHPCSSEGSASRALSLVGEASAHVRARRDLRRGRQGVGTSRTLAWYWR